MRDLESEPVRSAVRAFTEGMRNMRRHLAQADELRYTYQKERWFLDAVAVYCQAVTAGNTFLSEVALRAVLASLTEPQAITYRQHVLADCLDHPTVVREIYDLAVEAITLEKGSTSGCSGTRQTPSSTGRCGSWTCS
jgi:hypothetical protein